MSLVELQTHASAGAVQTEYLAVPVLLNLRASLELPIAPAVEDGPAVWIPCGAPIPLPHSQPPLPEGEMVCVIALYPQDSMNEAGRELQEGLPLTPVWLRSVLRRGEWDDAIVVGPVLSFNEAHAVGQYMYAVAAGQDDARTLARDLSPEVLDVAERAARRFRAELQVLLLR